VTTPDNPFASSDAGVVYARGRPFHHPRSLARILAITGSEPIGNALDVACGTGMSTVALAEHAISATGVDASSEMLRAARAAPRASYVLGHAEGLPFPSDAFDAATCCSGVHWFDQRRFFAELHRVLRHDGWVGLYDHYFMGEMVDVPEFGTWTKQLFKTFPLPKRTPQVGDPRAETPRGFEKIADEFFADDIEMSHEAFADYQLTISNFQAASERGTPRTELRAWLLESSEPLFAGAPARTLKFLGSITCLRRLP
jgi:ubiquinone/menaquinone biosynthesis C-methylase UbiE